MQQNQIIDNEGQIQSSVYEFLKTNQDKLEMLKLSDERYQEILTIFTDNRNYIKDGNKKQKMVKIRQNKWEEFKQVWETINKKPKIVYQNINENNIIEDVTTQFNRETIEPIRITRYAERYNSQSDKIETLAEEQIGEVDFFQTQKFTDFLDLFVKKEKFPFGFMVKMLNKIDKQKIKNNPKKAQERLLTILKDTLHGSLLSQVHYEFLDTIIYPNDLQNEQGKKKPSIPYTLLGKNFIDEEARQELLYDTICFDSEIEKTIQQNDPLTIKSHCGLDPQSREIPHQVRNDGGSASITVFAKLPKISIPTPYKSYNPDFAYLIKKQDGNKLFLVVEAKGYESKSDIPEAEQQKIDYAQQFFKDLQQQMPDVEIQYKTRINGQSLLDLLSSKP